MSEDSKLVTNNFNAVAKVAYEAEEKYGMPKLPDDDYSLIGDAIISDWSLPDFKLKHFIANSHIHPMHRARQLLMELNSRQENYEQFVYDLENLEIRIEIEKELMETAATPGQKKLHELEARQLNVSLVRLKEKLKHSWHERNKFLRNLKEFNESELGRHTDGRLFIDILKDDPEECERIEAKYWEYRLGKQAALDMIAYGRVGVGNMEAIMQMPADAQNKALAMAYEVLITNEKRMNLVQDKVQALVDHGQPVSDITALMEIKNTESLMQLTQMAEKIQQLAYNPEGRDDDTGNNNVPLIQKR